MVLLSMLRAYRWQWMDLEIETFSGVRTHDQRRHPFALVHRGRRKLDPPPQRWRCSRTSPGSRSVVYRGPSLELFAGG